MTQDDDLEWLYRQGRYADDSAPGPAGAGGPRSDASRPAPDGAGYREQPRSGDYRDQPRRQPSSPTDPSSRAGNAPPSGRPPAPPRTATAPAPRTPAPRTPPAANRRRRPRVLRTVGLVLVALLAYLIAVPVVAWSGVSKVDATPTGARPPQQPGQLILLAGSDSREGLTSEQRKRLGMGSTEGQRTDTILLLYLPDSGKPALISLPRDSYVEIPGHRKNKINASYAIGGPKLLASTVEQATGLRIDGYAEIGFGGFVSMIDAVGGIELCLKSAIKDKDAHLDVPAGCQNMDGVTALGYVRMRKSDPRGDLGRVERQRQMLSALAKKMASPWSVINPVRYWGLNRAGATSLTTGNEVSVVDLGRIGLGFLSVSRGDGLTLTVPVSNAYASSSVGSVVLWDQAKASKMFDMLARGDTSQLTQFQK